MARGPVLLVDAGNTRVKWALLAQGVLSPARAVVHAQVGLANSVRPAWAELARPQRVLVGSVAGAERDAEVRALCRELWACEPVFAMAQARAAGVTSGYDSPGQLGVDRWLALLAVHADRRGSTCVVDCGTAVTIDLIDAAGLHRGGLILPGLQLMQECLLAGTRIPAVRPLPARPEPGRETAAAIANGALLAAAGAVRETLAHARGTLGALPRLVIAGGDAGTLAAALEGPAELRPDLVLEGLAVLAGIEAT
jgi:type III pantothenate kinase